MHKKTLFHPIFVDIRVRSNYDYEELKLILNRKNNVRIHETFDYNTHYLYVISSKNYYDIKEEMYKYCYQQKIEVIDVNEVFRYGVNKFSLNLPFFELKPIFANNKKFFLLLSDKKKEKIKQIIEENLGKVDEESYVNSDIITDDEFVSNNKKYIFNNFLVNNKYNDFLDYEKVLNYSKSRCLNDSKKLINKKRNQQGI
jgi:hypothetical protein